MRISSGHLRPEKIEEIGGNFAHKFRKAVLEKKPAILIFDGEDLFDFVTPPDITKDAVDNIIATA